MGTEEFERKTIRGGKEGRGKGRKTVGKEGSERGREGGRQDTQDISPF